MDPPPPAAAAAGGKLRLLCSYGGHIIPRPQSTTLTYAGGDTKLLSLPRQPLSLSSLSLHLSQSLHVSPPFLIKYQLPGEDLDNLVSVATDDDLLNMIEEHPAAAPRIRLFLFPSKPESLGSGLLDPKSDSWFCDALKGVNLIRRGVSSDSGLAGTESGGGDVAGIKGGSGQESVVLETSSSFGSTGSSVSMTNLPSIAGNGGEENAGCEKRPKLPPSAFVESDNAIPSVMSHHYSTMYQDSSVQHTSEATARPRLVESAGVFHNPVSGFQVQKTAQAGSHQAPNQIQHQQEFQYIQAGSHYMPQYSATPSFYPIYHPPLSQHSHNPYQQSQPYPVYYLPMRPTQPPTHCSLVDTSAATPAPPHPQMQPPASKEVVSASAAPLIEVPLNPNQQQLVDISEIESTTQPIINSEFDDDFAYTQIYKTQPSESAFISRYQTMMTNADNIK